MSRMLHLVLGFLLLTGGLAGVVLDVILTVIPHGIGPASYSLVVFFVLAFLGLWSLKRAPKATDTARIRGRRNWFLMGASFLMVTFAVALFWIGAPGREPIEAGGLLMALIVVVELLGFLGLVSGFRGHRAND